MESQSSTEAREAVNQVTIVAYPPGAYGSFLSWMIERFSKHRTGVTDDPLLPDGSSHAYASFCKVKGISDFMIGLNEARWDIKPWHTNIYAGWPSNPLENLEDNINDILDWMMPYDRMVFVDACHESDHMLFYLRNEATMDRDRWYDMLGIDSDGQLADRLRFDIEGDRLRKHDDPRMMSVTIDDILVDEPAVLWNRMNQFLGWPMEGFEHFNKVIAEMRRRQEKFYHMIDEVGPVGTPAQKAIYRYLMEENNGS
jgi:hypothetical protein